MAYLDWYEDPPDPPDRTGWFESYDDDEISDEEKAEILAEHPSLTAEQRNPTLR